jgi:isopentenyl diphosphate isomerase/L-lactate dehydrogenase-like FMN-dependent dehydrogenase
MPDAVVRRVTRRQALGSVGGIVAQTVSAAQPPRTNGAPRLTPREQLVNVLEYEEQAKRVLSAAAYAAVAGGDRSAFERITLRPRMMVPVLDLNLGVTLFGQAMFAPILVAPIARQGDFHADGERATVAGASAAKAVTVISSQSSVPLASLAAAGTVPLWYQVFAQDPSAPARIQEAVTAGCRAICVTIGAPPKGARQNSSTLKADLAALDTLTRNLSVPVLVKGITTPEEAKLALQHHVQGLIVSSYNAKLSAEGDGSVLSLAAIVDAVGGRAPVLADGSFRRCNNINNALEFGAMDVLVGRPAMWGLAAYGAAGVQGVVEMLQTELARYMAMCGKPNVAALDRTMLRIHRASTARAQPATGG